VFDGVMIGREAYSNPYLLALLHRAVVDQQWSLPSREEIIERYVPYVQDRLTEGHRLRSMVRHVQGLYAGLPRVRSWRRFISEGAAAPDARAELLIDALRIVRAAA
jgi:tRNA-dihydrouridine synthase A